MKAAVLAAAAAVVALAGRADAYPQWQLSRDVTCTSCHLSPDGGGLLNENGLATAQAIAWKSYEPAFVYGKLDVPDWLVLGGDVRGAAGVIRARDTIAAGYPMQAELAATAMHGGFSLHAIGGLRRPQEGGSPVHVAWSREHYAMWQQEPGGTSGLYVRAGRLLPTFGLRLAEHVVYTQRFGGRPLYYEAYALAISFVESIFEVHATAFTHDAIASAAEHGDGAALYTEMRIGTHAALGLEGKVSISDEQTRSFGGVVGKLYVPSADVTLLGEAQLIRQHIDAGDFETNQIAAYLLASRPLPHNLLLDVGIGHFTQDTRVDGLYRDCVDANVHWFADSHTELLLTTRVERLGGGDPMGGYALAQLHYRL